MVLCLAVFQVEIPIDQDLITKALLQWLHAVLQSLPNNRRLFIGTDANARFGFTKVHSQYVAQSPNAIGPV